MYINDVTCRSLGEFDWHRHRAWWDDDWHSKLINVPDPLQFDIIWKSSLNWHSKLINVQTIDFLPSYLPVISMPSISHPATRLNCPPHSKNVVFIPKITLFQTLCQFDIIRKAVKLNRFQNGNHISNSPRQALISLPRKFAADTNFVWHSKLINIP